MHPPFSCALPRSVATGLLGKEAPAKESLKEHGTIWEQFRSAAFLRVTTFIVVGSFWANFYIGTIDIQVHV
jgi:hypothetical protein